MYTKSPPSLIEQIRTATTNEQRERLACAYHFGLDPSRIAYIKTRTDGGGHFTGIDVVLHIDTGRRIDQFIKITLATATIDSKTHNHGYCSNCDILWWWPRIPGKRDFRILDRHRGPECVRCRSLLKSTRHVSFRNWMGAPRGEVLAE